MPAPTVVRVWKDPKKRDQAQYSQKPGQQMTLQSQEGWFVLYNGFVDQFTPATAVGLPTLGMTVGGLVACTGVMPVRSAGNPYLWEVQVTWERITPAAQGAANNRNITLNYGQTTFTQTCYFDRLGKSFCNVNGELLPTQPTKTYYDEEISINFQADAVPNLSTIRGCLGCANSDAVSFTICGLSFSFLSRQMVLTSAPIKTSRVLNADSTQSILYDITLNFHCLFGSDSFGNPNKFVWNAPNMGWNVIDPTDEAAGLHPPPVPGAFGGAISAPVKLAADGSWLSDPTDVPVWLPQGFPDYVPGRFEIEDETAFSGLFTDIVDP